MCSRILICEEEGTVDEKRTDLKAALRELAAEDSGNVGRHVGLKRLIAYRQGRLPAAEREALQEHLSLCTRCAGLLLELRDFEAASAQAGAAGPEDLRQEAWDSLAQHLPRKGSAIRPITSADRREAPRRRLPYFIYGAAAALLLAVVGLSVWSMVRPEKVRTLSADPQVLERLTDLEERLKEREEELAAARHSLAEAERQLAAAHGEIQGREKRPEQATSQVRQLETRVAELTSALEELRRNPQAPPGRIAVASREIAVSVSPRFVLRGQESSESRLLRAGGAVNPVQIPAQEDRFTVGLSLADHPVYGEYRFELMDREGEVLWAGRRQGKALQGDAGTSVSVAGLAPGLYRLRVEGLYPDRSELLAEYLLKVLQGTES
jgi:hypothetical protein